MRGLALLLAVGLIALQLHLLRQTDPPPGGTLYLSTEPPGALIEALEEGPDGLKYRPIGKSPGPINKILPGVFNLRISKPGYRTAELQARQLLGHLRFPEEGSLVLELTNPIQPALDFLQVWYPSVLLGGLGLAVYLGLLRPARRARLEASLRAQRFLVGIIEPGTVLERYQVVRKLGEGGMAQVFEVRWLDQPEAPTRALKLHKEGDRERYLREARVSLNLRHPHVVSFLDCGEWEGAPFLVMEKVEGQTLDEALQAQKPSLSRVLDWHAQVARALGYLHENAIVHRDVKPSNVMIGKDGRALLMDFGIARALGPTDLTGEGQVVGTPGFMAPEQLMGRELDWRADLYSLGAMLYLSCTGRPAHPGETAVEIMRRQLTEDPPSLRALRPDLEPALTDLVDRLLSREPERRADTPGQVADELARLRKS